MPIDFNDEQNRLTYAGRSAHESWNDAILSLIHPNGLRIVDVGCGGGIYSRAWTALGASEVVGVDSSPTMISAAAESCVDLRNASFRIGDAQNTGMPANSVDVVFARALIHHLNDIHPLLDEAMRILKPGGMVLFQDRTPEDSSLPGSWQHIRGYFFECFPRLLDVERSRRKSDEVVMAALQATGFVDSRSKRVWETRTIYPSKAGLCEDIRRRTGRSILHELNDDEIRLLVSLMDERLPENTEIVEKDRWTIWSARKP